MYDFAIIGSGASGGRMAYELTAGGAKCVLIEAGRAFDRHSFPPGELGYSTQMFWGGGLEVSRDARFGFLRGKCLGGTSVVNQADLDRFDDLAWDDWRDRTGVDFFRTERMDPYYDELDRAIPHGEIPRSYYNRNAELFIQGFDKTGYHWKPIDRAQDDCKLDHGSDCIVCLGGCPRNAKQSTLVNAIPQAQALGLDLECEFDVERVEDRRTEVRLVGRQHGAQRELVARRAILAAGSLGNTALLLRSTDLARRLPALGRNFCCHPQYMTYGVHDEPVDAHKGALQSVQAHDRRLREAGIKIENVFAPPIATAMLLPGVGRAHHAQMRNFRHLACVEVAVRDEPLGTMKLGRGGKLIVDKPLSAADRAKIDEGLKLALATHEHARAKQIIRCDQGFGLHLMGGCPMGTDARTSVVASDFHLHGFDNLIAADSSIFPTAPGINPSFTIMALSLRASRELLAR